MIKTTEIQKQHVFDFPGRQQKTQNKTHVDLRRFIFLFVEVLGLVVVHSACVASAPSAAASPAASKKSKVTIKQWLRQK